LRSTRLAAAAPRRLAGFKKKPVRLFPERTSLVAEVARLLEHRYHIVLGEEAARAAPAGSDAEVLLHRQ